MDSVVGEVAEKEAEQNKSRAPMWNRTSAGEASALPVTAKTRWLLGLILLLTLFLFFLFEKNLDKVT